MNKKGFTLIELLAVIVLLSIIVVIAVPSAIGISRSVKKQMLEKKITMIEEAAELYGQDNNDTILNSSEMYGDYKCITIKAGILVPEYIDKDNPNETRDCGKIDATTGEVNANCIVDPNDDTKYLDNAEIIIYLRNRRVKAVMKYEDFNSDAKCD